MIVLKNISDLSALFQQEKPRHPLITVIDFTVTDEKEMAGSSISAGFYSVMFKNYCSNRLKYGREYYDFQEGSLLCVAPGQVITLDSEFDHQVKKEGWGVFFTRICCGDLPCSKSTANTAFSRMLPMKRFTCRTRKEAICTSV